MIIRTDGDALLFITQPDHARLAADAIGQWADDGFPAHPRRGTILFAVREHDNGWLEEDAATFVDADGRPLDFVQVPTEVRQRIWPRAVNRVAPRDPYAAALIAQHAISVYGHMRPDTAWDGFFTTLAQLRLEMLARCDTSAAETIDADYAFVNAADRLSLAFCTGWPKPLESFGRRFILASNTVEVDPDPFAGVRVPMRVLARRLPNRPYASAAALRTALEAAPVEWLNGSALGR